MNKKTRFLQSTLIVSLLWIISLSVSGAFAAFSAQTQESLKQTIATLYKARSNIIRNHQKQAGQTSFQETDKKDFVLFLSYIDGRIYYYCQELYRIDGAQAIADSPCPVASDGTPETNRYSAIPATTNSKTSEEEIAELDSNFSSALGEFDEMLLKEQEQIATHIPKQREGSGSSDTEGNEEGNGTYGDSSKQTRNKPSSSGKSGQNTRNNEPNGENQVHTDTGSNNGTGTGSTRQSRVPPTSGNKDLSQSDDDIVAKQLKEAAEQETDPEVKARLWEEYRKYKEGT